MKGYAFVDKTNGNIDYICSWGDDKDLPSNYIPKPNQEIVVIDDMSMMPSDLGYNYCYNINTKEFKMKIKVEVDINPISYIDGVSNISIIYPEDNIIDNVDVTIDNQTVNLQILKKITTIPFTSQVIGGHCILIESKTCWGKTYSALEVK